MKKLFPLIIFLFLIKEVSSQNIMTIAGNGICCNHIDGGLATNSSLYYPNGVAIDGNGNIFISEPNFIRKIDANGILTCIGGSLPGGYSGDSGLALNAHLESDAFALDNFGNIFLADWFHNVVRKIDHTGFIYTVAGNGYEGFSGDGGLATAAELNGPSALAVDNLGNLYIADTDNNRIRKVNSSGIITTIAGIDDQGFSGDGGLATNASLHDPSGIALDVSGNIYFGDKLNHRIRKINTTGIISTVAGTGTPGFSGDGGPAILAEISEPSAMVFDFLGNLFFCEPGLNDRVRAITPDGNIKTVAGNGIWGYSGDGGPATAAALKQPMGIAVDNSGTLYIADLQNFRIRKVDNPIFINEISSRKDLISISPNPFSSSTTIHVAYNCNHATLTILNIYGELVEQFEFSGQKINLQRSSLPSGVYFIRIVQGTEIFKTEKLVIGD